MWGKWEKGGPLRGTPLHGASPYDPSGSCGEPRRRRQIVEGVQFPKLRIGQPAHPPEVSKHTGTDLLEGPSGAPPRAPRLRSQVQQSYARVAPREHEAQAIGSETAEAGERRQLRKHASQAQRRTTADRVEKAVKNALILTQIVSLDVSLDTRH